MKVAEAKKVTLMNLQYQIDQRTVQFPPCLLDKKQLFGLQAVESELRRYNDEEVIDLDADPLVWWSKRECRGVPLTGYAAYCWKTTRSM